MHHRSYDISIVVDETRGRGGARRDLIGEEGVIVVLLGFWPRMGNSPTSCLSIFIDQWEDYNGVSSMY